MELTELKIGELFRKALWGTHFGMDNEEHNVKHEEVEGAWTEEMVKNGTVPGWTEGTGRTLWCQDNEVGIRENTSAGSWVLWRGHHSGWQRQRAGRSGQRNSRAHERLPQECGRVLVPAGRGETPGGEALPGRTSCKW